MPIQHGLRTISQEAVGATLPQCLPEGFKTFVKLSAETGFQTVAAHPQGTAFQRVAEKEPSRQRIMEQAFRFSHLLSGEQTGTEALIIRDPKESLIPYSRWHTQGAENLVCLQ